MNMMSDGGTRARVMRACVCEARDKEGSWRGSQGEALEPHLCTFKPLAILEIEVGDTLREVLDIACVQVFVSGS